MTASPIFTDFLNPQNLRVLDAYNARAVAAKKTVEGFDGWLERIDELDELSMQALTAIHGQLIAAGYLKFEIGSSSVGLKYQISPKGKQAMERGRQLEQADDSAEHTAAEHATNEAA